jgi:hypothetical protein
MGETLNDIQRSNHKTPKVIFSSSLYSDAGAILFTLSSIREDGSLPVPYTLPPNLPSKILKLIDEKKDIKAREELIKWLSNMVKPDYQEAVSFVEKRWHPLEKDYFKEMQQITGIFIAAETKGDIVRYGVGGAYFPPENRFTLWWNGNTREPRFKRDYPEYTIAHEVTHLLLHTYIKAAELSQTQKERLIDLFFIRTPLLKIFPEYSIQSGMDYSIDTKFSWEAICNDPAQAILNLK